MTVEELARHRHSIAWHASSAISNKYAVGSGTSAVTDLTGYEGMDKAHNNVQPCKAVYVWRRFN